MKVISADEVVKEAKLNYYKDPKAESRFEDSFVIGWLKSAYDKIADELNERRGNKKKAKEIEEL